MADRINISKELEPYKSYGGKTADVANIYLENEKKRQEAFDKELKDIKEQHKREDVLREAARKKELANAQLTAAEIAKINKKYNDLRKKEQQKFDNEMDAHKKKVAKSDKDMEERVSKHKEALNKIAFNDYVKMDLESKKQVQQNRKKDQENFLKDLEVRRATGQRISKEDIKREKEAQDEIAKIKQLELGQLEAKREAKAFKANFVQQAAFQKEDRQNRRNAHKENMRAMEEELAVLKKEAELEGWTAEDVDKHEQEIKARFLEKEDRANSEFGEFMGKDDADNDLAGSIADFGELVGGLAGGGGAFGAIGGAIGGIAGLADVLVAGNPIGIIVKVLELIAKIVGKISKVVTEGIEKYVSLQNSYLAKINTRLDTGLDTNDRTYQKITAAYSTIFGSSRYFNQQALIEKLADLTEQGIAYNLEQRTILATLSERMVSTFDMLDEHLVNLTKLQQADMSAAQIGAESKLTQLFNTVFEDTSYLSNEYDSITTSLMDTLSQMTADESVAFSYNVNKWLGGLYALGMSSSGVEKIAQGINYLGTGNVEAFNSDDSLRTLFAMASQGAYSDILVNGINSSNIDQLLENVVSYLASIYDDTNKVVKNVKAGVFGGLSQSDIRAAYNLSGDQANALKSSRTNWSNATSQLQNYLIGFAEDNTTRAIKAQNLMDNTFYNIGEDFVNNHEIAYVTYLIGSTIGGTIGDGIAKLAAATGGIGSVVEGLGEAVHGLNTDINDALLAASSFSVYQDLGLKGTIAETADTASELWDSTKTGFKNLWNGFLNIFRSDENDVPLEARQKYSEILSDYGTALSQGNFLMSGSYWNLDASNMIKNRGQSIAGSLGAISGISASTDIPTIVNTLTAGLASPSATASITNYNDASLERSMYENSTTVQAGAYQYREGATLARDINDLYRALFEDLRPIKVILTEVEEKAKGNLVEKTYNVDEIPGGNTSNTINELQRSNTRGFNDVVNAIGSRTWVYL